MGNFRSLFINNRSGKADAEKAIKIIPVVDSPGFGDLDKLTRAYYNNKVVPLQQDIMEINEKAYIVYLAIDNEMILSLLNAYHQIATYKL